jgi:TrmH family RNA methyltransferase
VITSVDNPRVKEVLRLRRSRERRASGLLVAEGRREVERALGAGLVARATYVAPELIDDWPHPAEEVSARVLARMSYRDEPEGVLAIFEAPQRPVPAGATLVLVAVGIEKPGNLGAMARTADAAGADALSSRARPPTRGTRTRSAARPEPSSPCPSSTRRSTTCVRSRCAASPRSSTPRRRTATST